MKRFGILLLLILVPSLASAWWQDDWGFKKKITLDAAKLKQDGISIPENSFALIRLHTGNFMSFTELAEQGKDIRLLAPDEKTPLKFYIEKIDPVNEMAFIWVQLSKDVISSPEPGLWLYFGNAAAVTGQDMPASFDVNEVLNYPFLASGIADATANANNPSEATAANVEGGLIGGAAQLQGSQIIRVKTSPSLVMAPATGWTVSAWVKIDQPQPNAVLVQRSGVNGGFALTLKEQALGLEVSDSAGAKQEFNGTVAVTPGAWHHIAMTATADNATLYLDGAAAGSFPVKLPELTSEMTIGAAADASRGFAGLIDSFSVYKVARDPNAIKFDVAMQGAGSALLTYGDDQTPDSEEGGESYFVATLQNVTIDGWVVIGVLGVMFVISLLVMLVKTIVINRTHSENKKFEEAFSKLNASDVAALNADPNQEDDAFEESPLLFSLTSHHNTFAGSSLYRIYHVGVEEMNKRLTKLDGNDEKILSARSVAAVKASMDAVLIRELQKLNSLMVLLTIAISGGPFLGLLGTVVGVMITFAAIAVSGEVNVNSIAPGIAAALAATVAGLAVAIPSLFGYNYLGSRIKVVAADMQVFVDEFVAKLAEEHT